jgi:hypothetical protein
MFCGLVFLFSLSAFGSYESQHATNENFPFVVYLPCGWTASEHVLKDIKYRAIKFPDFLKVTHLFACPEYPLHHRQRPLIPSSLSPPTQVPVQSHHLVLAKPLHQNPPPPFVKTYKPPQKCTSHPTMVMKI